MSRLARSWCPRDLSKSLAHSGLNLGFVARFRLGTILAFPKDVVPALLIRWNQKPETITQ